MSNISPVLCKLSTSWYAWLFFLLFLVLAFASSYCRFRSWRSPYCSFISTILCLFYCSYWACWVEANLGVTRLGVGLVRHSPR